MNGSVYTFCTSVRCTWIARQHCLPSHYRLLKTSHWIVCRINLLLSRGNGLPTGIANTDMMNEPDSSNCEFRILCWLWSWTNERVNWFRCSGPQNEWRLCMHWPLEWRLILLRSGWANGVKAFDVCVSIAKQFHGILSHLLFRERCDGHLFPRIELQSCKTA